jgi:peptidyl-tRNA hydrolase
VVRRDLPRGTQAAQLIHAAGHSSSGKLPNGTFAVALTVKDEDELRQLAERLKANSIPHELIFEPDPPYNGQLMALGISPGYKSSFRRYLSNLPLVK